MSKKKRIANSIVIDKLQKYFIKQNPEIVARLAANLLIDIRRFLNLDSLEPEEVESLFERSQKSMKMVYLVAEEEWECHEPLKLDIRK